MHNVDIINHEIMVYENNQTDCGYAWLGERKRETDHLF